MILHDHELNVNVDYAVRKGTQGKSVIQLGASYFVNLLRNIFRLIVYILYKYCFSFFLRIKNYAINLVNYTLNLMEKLTLSE